MLKFITGNIKQFWEGAISFGVTGGTFIFFQNIFLLDLVMKLIVALLIAILGGLGTALAADIYKHHIKHKIFKNKQDGNREKDKAA